MVCIFSDWLLGVYYFYDLQQDSIWKIMEVSLWLDEVDMVFMKLVFYKIWDGEEVYGYLIVFKNKEGEKMLVVINLYGGLWVCDSWGYNLEVQLLASWGYVVF